MAVTKAKPKPEAASPKKTVNAGNISPKPETSEQKTVDIPIVRFCSFCGKSSETKRRLIAGPNNVFICDECVEVCVTILFSYDKDDWLKRFGAIIAGKNKFTIKHLRRKPKEIN